MKALISFFFKLILFWLCLFALQHALFLSINSEQLTGYSTAEVASSFFYSFPMDLSASGYLLLLPTILIFISLFTKQKARLISSIHIINITLILCCLIIGIADLGLYLDWGSKINGKAISYLAFPMKAAASLSAIQYLQFGILLTIQAIAAIYIYKKRIQLSIPTSLITWQKVLFIPVVIFVLLLFIRGGLQTFPIGKSWVYYSKNATLNYSAVNGFWNFMDIFANPVIKNNPYNYFSNEKANSLVREMHPELSDTTTQILKSDRPNIVFILLESVSGECMKKLGGAENIMPMMDSLASDGLLFTNFYANGFRTEQGQISILTSFPAQPKTTIMRMFGKFDKLPSLTRKLNNNGYSINYYYSGNTDFANTEAFLKSSGFTKILNENNYPWQHTTKWGAYDEELFNCHIKEGNLDSQPFFSVLMTSTNHEPFDADVEKVFKGKSNADSYKNTVHYTDKCVWNYLQFAKNEPWYSNTLFVIMADHAHSLPSQRGANEPERHHIPFLLYGDMLKEEFKGKTVSRIGSQIDFPAILLGQMNIDHSEFWRSKDLLKASSSSFAYYAFDNGFGIISKDQTLVYDHNLSDIVYRKNNNIAKADSVLLNQGKAYLQNSFAEYIGFNN